MNGQSDSRTEIRTLQICPTFSGLRKDKEPKRPLCVHVTLYGHLYGLTNKDLMFTQKKGCQQRLAATGAQKLSDHQNIRNVNLPKNFHL